VFRHRYVCNQYVCSSRRARLVAVHLRVVSSPIHRHPSKPTKRYVEKCLPLIVVFGIGSAWNGPPCISTTPNLHQPQSTTRPEHKNQQQPMTLVAGTFVEFHGDDFVGILLVSSSNAAESTYSSIRIDQVETLGWSKPGMMELNQSTNERLSKT